MTRVLITGGAGFIGVNAAIHFYKLGWQVDILDNLSRKGTDKNISWLLDQCPNAVFHCIDIRNYDALADTIRQLSPDYLLHLAAQVAVTTSYQDPREDFEINALGSFNVLESIRNHSPHTFILYASTNKVYGGMESIPVVRGNHGYKFTSLEYGVPEIQPLDFHSPYGCSKGVADQYVIDYARIYDLQTCSFRQSCIYGPRQFGIEDQGWVAWFTIAALLGRSITLYGDGWQTRDVLHVYDLINAYEAAWNHRNSISGQAFNIGGGSENTLCLRDLIALLEAQLSIEIKPNFAKSRPGDQPVFICDIRKARDQLNWNPHISVEEGVVQLIDWVQSNQQLFSWLTL